jgi:DNA-binding transcriptional LysR family regulator
MEYLAISETFAEEPFLKKLSVSHTDLGKLINPDEWEITASSMLPITRRLSCARILGAFRPLMNQIAQEPEEGWLPFVYQTAVNHLYFRPDLTHTPLQQDAALCFLHVLRALFDEERRVLPFDFIVDGEPHSLTLPGPVTVSSATAYGACCLAGLGFMQAPRYNFEAELASGELVEVFADWQPAPLPATPAQSSKSSRT